MWGRSGADVYAVGGIDEYSCCDIKLHWEGGSWTRMDDPPAVSPGLEQWYGEALRAAWGTEAGLFVVGTGPTILYRER